MAYAPPAIGLLGGAYRPGGVIRTAFAVAERTGATGARVALRWVRTRPEITVVVIGADGAVQLDEVKSVELRSSVDDVDASNRVPARMGLIGW